MSFTPSIKLEHSDSRGEIYSISLPGEKELMLLHSVAGALRGGHAHDCDEVIVLLTGKIEYTKRGPLNEWHETMYAGEVSFVRQGVYHLGEFLDDSWLLEWKLTADKNSWRNINWPPYREKVNASLAH